MSDVSFCCSGYSFCEVVIECAGLLPQAKGSTLCRPAEWPHGLWGDVVSLLVWPFFLSRPALLRALNLTTERLWPHVSRNLLLFLSQSILAVLALFLHPKRLADLVGITNDIEALAGVSDIIARVCSAHESREAISSAPLGEILAVQTERDVRREIRRLFSYLSDYKMEEKSPVPQLSDSAGQDSPSQPTRRESTGSDSGLSVSSSSSVPGMPSRVQIQKNAGVIREFFQALNTVKAAMVSFLKTGIAVQRRSGREIEEIMTVFNDRLSGPANLMLMDMWNKVLSHLMLMFEDFSRGVPAQAVAELQLKEIATRQAQELSSRIERANQQITDLQREKQELKSTINTLKKENEHIVDTFSCAVCFENLLAREPVCLDCGHLFCHPCVKDAAKSPGLGNRCPLCRQPFTKIVQIKGTQQ